MAEYIKREDALGCVLGVFDRQRIKELPAADVEEVKHGHVITIFKSTFEQYEPSIYGCSVCKCRITRDSKFCKHCGAKMDLED